jgi:hypothetical protein
MLLCSLLIGVGYNAFCVYGKAPREITTKNESTMECMFLEQGAFKGDDDDKPKIEAETNEFKIIKK